MNYLARMAVFLGAFAGFAIASQAPEFTQQYRQRIGGAVEELEKIVVDFDRDASRSQLSRSEALERMSLSPDGFVRDRSASMDRAIRRYEALVAMQARLLQAPEILHPVILARRPDPAVMSSAWSDFRPALPVTASGLAYGGSGAVAGGIVFAILALLLKKLAVARRKRRELDALQKAVRRGQRHRQAD